MFDSEDASFHGREVAALARAAYIGFGPAVYDLSARATENGVAPQKHVEALSDKEVEYAALLEHRRWMNERLQAGWIAGPTRDDARRIHPDLVPYDNLPESSKNYDRQAARSIVDVLAAAGLALCRQR